MSFTKLPSELRLQVYGHILQSVRLPVPQKLHQYRGLLLSCRRIFQEIEFEAMKIIQQFLARVQLEWPSSDQPLRILQPTCLSESANICVGFPHEFLAPQPCQTIDAVDAILNLLLEELPSFTLYVWNNDPDYYRSVSFADVVPLHCLASQLQRLVSLRKLNPMKPTGVPRSLFGFWDIKNRCVYQDHGRRVIDFNVNYNPNRFKTGIRRFRPEDEATRAAGLEG